MHNGISPASSLRRGLAIDMDGTLLDSMKFHAHAWQRAFQSQGLNPPLDWFYLWEGIRSAEVVDKAAVLLGVEIEPQVKQEILRLKLFFFETIFEPLPMPGLKKLFQTIQQLNYPVAIVTGSERRIAVGVLAALHLDGMISGVVGGDEIHHGKPAPDPYVKAAELLNLQPANCLVLENAPMGIESARAAEMICIAVTTTLPSEELQQASYVVQSLDDFSELLLQEAQQSEGKGSWLPEFWLS